MSNENNVKLAAKKLFDLRNDSVQFVRQIFNAEPDVWQAESLDAIDDNHNVAIRSGHGVGKTTLLAWATIKTVACFPFTKVPCTAPTQHQLSDLLWAEIAYWLQRSKIKDLLSYTATKLAVQGHEDAWFAVARSCRVPENLAGFHAKKLIYIVDEGSGVPDVIFQVIDGALTTENAQILMAGNPTKRSGYFFDAFHKARSEWQTIHISSEDSNRVSKAYCEGMAKKWGRDTDIYRVRVLGDFPLAETDTFISLDMVEDAVNKYYDLQNEKHVGICEMGIDVARYGDDETVFCIRKGDFVLLLESHRGWSTTQTSARAVQLIKEFNVQTVRVDDTGVGGGVTDQLCLVDYGADIVPVNFGGSGDEHYANYASIMWGNLRNLLKSGDIAIPNDDDLVAQLTTRKYSISPKGLVVIERKEDMKKRDLPSPDRAEAMALAFAIYNDDSEIITATKKREAFNIL